MGAALDDAAAVTYQQLIGLAYDAQTVGDDKGGAAAIRCSQAP